MEKIKIFFSSTSSLEVLLLITAILLFCMLIVSYRKIKKGNVSFLPNNMSSKNKTKNMNKGFSLGIHSSKDNSFRMSKFNNTLRTMLISRNKKDKSRVLSLSFFIILFFIFLVFLRLNSVLLAVVIPLIIYVLMIKILEELTIGFDAIIFNNFQTLINHMIKHFSKTNDLSIILYNSSKEVEEPLRSLILRLSREVMVNNEKQKFLDLIEDSNNLWLHAFLLTLVSYKENSSKENIINNLSQLAELIEKRRKLNLKMINDRKPVIIVNYLLLIVGVFIFFSNIFLNPIIKSFIVSPTGVVSVIVGVSCMFLTVLINIKLSK